ncbi:calcium-dependent protein kinase 6 isoform X1 [Diorhabda carinulata]|uniref:calcium-dependent protein kinase 6 isoform X1 n=1 Tax=Diorhabda carinulata TaxID=1163345 RepID=UPI0025A02D8F|nr:calcium-dependent protein kinase 6 isoform X1 [Diorhabda carinulata]
MDLTNYFKITKIPYTFNNLSKKESLSYEENIKKGLKNKPNNQKYYKNHTENDSEGSSEDEISQKEKQIKLDALIKKISQSERNVEHQEINPKLSKETYVNSENFNLQCENSEGTTSILIEKSNTNSDDCTMQSPDFVKHGSNTELKNISFRQVMKDITNNYKYKDTDSSSCESDSDDKLTRPNLREYLNLTKKNTNRIDSNTYTASYSKSDSKRERFSNLVHNIKKKISDSDKTENFRNILKDLQSSNSKHSSEQSTEDSFDFTDPQFLNNSRKTSEGKDILLDGNLQKRRYSKEVDMSSSDSDTTVLQDFLKSPNALERCKNINNGMKSDNNNNTENTGIDNDSWSFPKTSKNISEIPQNQVNPNIFSSKDFLEEVSPLFEFTNDIDFLVGPNSNKHEPPSCQIFNDRQIYEILNKEYEKHLTQQKVMLRNPDSSQIFPSEYFVKEVSPVFDRTNDIKSLVGSSINKTESRRCPILNDEEIYGILNEAYEKQLKKQEMISNEASSSNISIIEKLTQRIPSDRIKHLNSGKCLKRYKKGKTKIYRLKKMKKLQVKSTEKSNESEIEGILKRMTQNYIYPESQFIESESCSSISTSSSYITDDNKSEVSTESMELNEPQQTMRMQLNKILQEEKLSLTSEILNNSEYEKKEIIRKIRDIFLRIYDDFSKGKSSYLKYRRQNFDNCIFKDRRLQFKPLNECTTSVIKSTAKNSRFKLILYLMNKIQILLETNTKLTKRELYYQMKEVIKNQSIMDNAINVVSCILDSGMWMLNIVAQKGLVYGELEILMSNGAILNCKVPGTSIPHDISEITEIQTTASFILVVEKEAIFYKLIEEGLFKKLPKSFIMITGKGFPDLNTQLFLRKLWTVMAVPIFILVDGDPHGVQIMLNYKFGSVHNAHVSQHLAVPNAKWLGIYPSEIKEFDIKTQSLTSKELKLIQQLLDTPYMDGNPGIAAELKVLLKNNYKAGIEGLMKSRIFLSEVYLPTKLATNKFVT